MMQQGGEEEEGMERFQEKKRGIERIMDGNKVKKEDNYQKL